MYTEQCNKQKETMKHFWLSLVIWDWRPIFAMFLGFSLEIICEVGGSNPIL